jgi:hypothetical protein
MTQDILNKAALTLNESRISRMTEDGQNTYASIEDNTN